MKNQLFVRRLSFAVQGISAAWRGEHSFRQQCLAAGLVVTTLCWFRPQAIWWALLLLSCGIVLAAELFNTALEHALDHLSPAQHPAVKTAKDCAAGAVLLLGGVAVVVFICFIAAMLGR